MCPQPIIRLRSRARPSGVMPAAERPFCSRISASASAVPDDAYAAVQCSRPNSFAITSISARAAVSAAANAVAVSLPLGKNRFVSPTQPIFSESSFCGVWPRPMMNSVEPPPMSTTSRGSFVAGSTWATPL